MSVLYNAEVNTDDADHYSDSAFVFSVAEYAMEIDLFERFAWIELEMKEVDNSLLDKHKTGIFSVVSGCPSTYAINTILRPQQVVAQALELSNGFTEQSLMNRFYRRFDGSALAEMHQVHQALFQKHSTPCRSEGMKVVDIDPTGLVANGEHYQFAESGYFANHRGAQGYQLSLASCCGEVVTFLLDPGNIRPTCRFGGLMYEIAETVGSFEELFIRADREFGSGPNVTFLVEHHCGFLLKGYDTRTARNLARRLRSQLQRRWVTVEADKDSVVQVADAGMQKIPNCPSRVHVYLERRRKKAGKLRYEYSHYVTSFPVAEVCEELVHNFYNERVTMESLIKDDKSHLLLKNLRTKDYLGIQAFLFHGFMAHNLMKWFARDVLKDTELECVRIPTMVRTLTRLHVPSVRKVNNSLRSIVFYVANCHRYVRVLLEATKRWLASHIRDGPHYVPLQTLAMPL